MPPPSPTTLRIEKVRNSALSAGTPSTSTLVTSETSGTSATAKAAQTSVVTSRSSAVRGFSTSRDQAGSATT